MQQQAYKSLIGIALKYARRQSEAEDLLQSAMLVAVEAGRSDISVLANRRWLFGTIKNLAAFDARSAIRRRQRETAWHDQLPTVTSSEASKSEVHAFALALPPRLRTAALLAIAGNTRAEIAWLLRVSDVAVRQYFTEIRRRWKAEGHSGGAIDLQLNGTLNFGLIRRSLRQHVKSRPQVAFATHDPDGHNFSFRLNSQKEV